MSAFRIFLSALILTAAILLYRGYKSTQDKRLATESAFLELVLAIEEGLSKSAAPLPDVFRAYESRELTECGFLPLVKEGVSPKDALARSINTLSSPFYDTLSRLFSRLGRSYLTEELSSLRAAKEALGEALERDGAECEKNKKAVGAVMIAAALGIIILLL